MPVDLSLTFGGVYFQLAFRGAVVPELTQLFEPYCSEGDDAPHAATAMCDVVLDDGLGRGLLGADDVRWLHDTDSVQLDSDSLRAGISRDGHTAFHAQVRMAPTDLGFSALLRLVGLAVIENVGGLLLHAAAVELDGEVVAFCGPSGAGKSTAVQLCQNAACFSYDQLVVFPYQGRYWAWATPWGTATGLGRGSAYACPLRALLRVTRGGPRPRVRWADSASSLFVVRDATNVSDYDLSQEQLRLSTCLDLCANVPVGHLNTVLGQPLDSVWVHAFEGDVSAEENRR